MDLPAYDALLLVSFGGPEGPDEVLPFLENVLRGKPVPRERMLEVAEHYREFSGVSPINAQNRALIAALEAELAAHGPRLPIYWGNRNWRPLLPDTLRQMAADGVRRALAFFTSAYSSYSGCRQYRENIADAQAVVGSEAPQIEKLRAFFNHPGFIEPMISSTQAAFEYISSAQRLSPLAPCGRGAGGEGKPDQAPLHHPHPSPLPSREREIVAPGHPVGLASPVPPPIALAFTAHSIPKAMAAGSRYEEQLREASRLVAAGAGRDHWDLVFQSRSGAPSQPWLEPDICDWLRKQHAAGTRDVVVVPIGFVSDHLEVVYDLDTEAQRVCRELGVNMVRAATVGTHPRFVRMIRELIVERTTPGAERLALGTLGASHDICAADCCLPGISLSLDGRGPG